MVRSWPIMLTSSGSSIPQRLELRTLSGGGTSTFAQDVREGLKRPERSLPSKYFYDEIGSALFDAICALPEYYLTRAETEILREWGWEIVRACGNPLDFLEFGSGSAVKTRILIEEALRVQRTLRYTPIDISGDALRAGAVSLVTAYPALTVCAYEADYFSIGRLDAVSKEHRVLAMLMGSNIGNYEPHEARRLLRAIAAALKSGDALLIGTDLKKDPRALELAYDDPAGVTAAFNRNLLARINRELGGTFDVRSFGHVARYDEGAGVVQSYLVAEKAATVRLEALGISVRFKRGDRIHTESSYKYSLGDVEALARDTGFGVAKVWADKQARFAVSLLRKDESDG
jgi:L-histidine N-alpha-methyltransferase